MTYRAVILHGYSARNRGDGLLVEETVALISEALGPDTEISLVASDPDSFTDLPVTRYCSRPTAQGWQARYLRELTRLHTYDLIVGVGGGYLRAGQVAEALKCALVMGPQLLAAALSPTPSVYLPQSIGPLRGGTRRVGTLLLNRLTRVMLRDDRSVAELGLANAVRLPDLAITSPGFTGRVARARPVYGPDPSPTVLSVRSVHGSVPPTVHDLARRLNGAGVPVTGYVQSSIGGNDDEAAQRDVTPDSVITDDEYLRLGEHVDDRPRVVVAVRLHAALLALRAGHRVIHLAYERKGFSAFADLGLEEWVHNVNDADVPLVTAQVLSLRDDPEVQRRYDARVRSVLPHLIDCHATVINELRDAVHHD